MNKATGRLTVVCAECQEASMQEAIAIPEAQAHLELLRAAGWRIAPLSILCPEDNQNRCESSSMAFANPD